MKALRLYLITDDAGRSPAELSQIVEAAICGGVTAVQLREKHADPHTLEAHIDALTRVCAPRDVALLLNADLAPRGPEPFRCAGFHCNSRTLARTADRLASSQTPLLLGYSAHSVDEAQSALAAGAHFVTVSPVFDTPSKRGILPPCGTCMLEKARQAMPRGVIVGLGGIDETNADLVMRAGADGIAVIRAIVASWDPEAAARRLRRIVDDAIRARRVLNEDGTERR